MITLNFAERYQQARLYAAQVRTRRAMGDKYDHAKPWRGPAGLKSSSRRLVSVQLESDASVAVGNCR